MSNLLYAAAKKYQAGGLSLIPINANTKRPASWLLPQAVTAAGEPLYWQQSGERWIQTTENTGSPKGTWEPYQRERPTLEDLEYWFTSGIKALAVVAGAVSGGVEVLDFDSRDGLTWFDEWCALAGGPIARYGLAVQRTGGGGYQVAWRCDEIDGNQKLAWTPAPEEAGGKKVMIETRGEGGYFLVAPSVHPSGRQYELLHGRFSQIPRITPTVRAHLLDCARQLNQVERPAPKLGGASTPYAGSSANELLEAYNRAHPITEMLRRYGYTEGAGNRWSRPGKADSMGVAILKDGKAAAYSSNDPLNTDRCGTNKAQPFSSFDLFAYYGHGEDYKAATKAAAVELGMAYEPRSLHTLLYVEDFAQAAVAREIMFPRGWVVRGFNHDNIRIADSQYETTIIWGYDEQLARRVARLHAKSPAHVITVSRNPDLGWDDAKTLANDGLLGIYLDAVLTDARGKGAELASEEEDDEPDDERPDCEPGPITVEITADGRKVFHFCPNPHLLQPV